MGGFKRESIKRDEAALSAAQRVACLGDLKERGVNVFCWCNRCSHNAVVEIDQLLAELGPAFPVPEVGAKMRCSGCGCKDVATRPDWPSLGQVANHT